VALVEETASNAVRRLFWAAVWLAVVLVAIKSYYLGLPEAFVLTGLTGYVRSLAAISYADVLFVAGFWASVRVAIVFARRRPRAARIFPLAFAAASALCCLYAVANVLIFSVFGGFLTYPLLALVGDVRMVRSSVGADMTPAAIVGLLGVPLAYVAALAISTTLTRPRHGGWRRRTSVALLLVVWVFMGQRTYIATWRSRPDRRIAANAQLVFLSSWWRAASGDGVVRMPDQFPPGDLVDFESGGTRSAPIPTAIRRASATLNARVAAARRPPNASLRARLQAQAS